MVSVGVTQKLTAAGVPTGGTTGQGLVKTSASDYATGWANVPPGGALPAPVGGTGVWYDTRSTVVAPSSGSSVNPNYTVWFPAFMPVSRSVSAIAVYALTGGSTVTLGVSSHDPSTGLPGTVIATGNVTLTTGQVGQWSPSLTIPAGWVWFSIFNIGSASITVPAVPVGSLQVQPMNHFGSGTTPAASTTPVTGHIYQNTTGQGIVSSPAAAGLTGLNGARPVVFFLAA